MARPLKLVTMIGARPQIIKSAAISRAVRSKFHKDLSETIIHTGQHYDAEMSQVFFDDLGLPRPDINLNIGEATPNTQLARMITGLDTALREIQPDVVLVYGDTNSTLAGTITAGKLNLPLAHVEAGLRSYDRGMPEELNRLACDHCSTWLFCPTNTAVRNLEKEGFDVSGKEIATPDTPRVLLTGDVMYDNTLHFGKIANERSKVLDQYGLTEQGFALATVHRANNTDDPVRLNAVFSGLLRVYEELEITLVLPVHPRTRKALEGALEPKLRKAMDDAKGIKILPPLGFLDMLALEQNARVVLTDSGGVQKEAYFFGKPCVILRSTTEWVEIVDAGRAILADTDPERILDASRTLLELPEKSMDPLFGDGHSAEKICEVLLG